MNLVDISKRNEWRAWLRKNRSSVDEVWLVFHKKHTGKPSIGYNDAVEEALCYGWIDSIKKRIDDEKYAYKFTPRKSKSNWSKPNKERVSKLIAEKKMTRYGLALVNEAKKDGSWNKKIASESKFKLPEELDKLLKKNKPAGKNFAKMTASQQRQYIVWVASAKKEATRLKRAQEALSLLIENKKLGLK